MAARGRGVWHVLDGYGLSGEEVVAHNLCILDRLLGVFEVRVRTVYAGVYYRHANVLAGVAEIGLYPVSAD